MTGMPVVVPLRDRPRVALAPSVARRLLRFELERLVADTGVRHQTIAGWLGVSRPSVSAALACSNLLSRPALEVLLGRMDRAEWFPRLSGLLATARRKTVEPGAAAVIGRHDAELVMGLEAFADAVTVFDPWLVPVHLRTPMYAEALTTLDNTGHNDAREQRQAPLLDDRDPLALRWITSEHALDRRVGGTPTMGAQRKLLVELAERHNVEVQVIPVTTELPPTSPFQMVHGTPAVVVEPSRMAQHYAHDQSTVRHFEHLTEELTRRALGTAESMALIQMTRA